MDTVEMSEGGNVQHQNATLIDLVNASQNAATNGLIIANGNDTNVDRLISVSTQTAVFGVEPDGFLEGQEMFHDIPDIEDLMDDMEIEEFIPWFRSSDNADDNKSDTSELPEPEDFRENQWSLENSQGIRVGNFGCFYEGAIDNRKMHGYGRLILRDRNQFIEGKWDSNRLIELNFTQLSHDFRNQTILIIKLKDAYLMTISEEKFVARATSSAFEDLNLAARIAAMKSSLFKKFCITDIVEDDLRSQRDVLLKTFESLLSNTTSDDADAINRAAVLILLSRYSSQRDAGKVLSAIERDKCVSNRLREAANNLLAIENALLDRKLDMFRLSSEIEEQRYLDLRAIIFNTYSKRIAEHRQTLINKCPYALPSMLSAIERLPAGKILYISKEDVGIFEHLVSVSNSEQYTPFFEWLLQGLVNKLREIEAYTPPSEVMPVMFPIYGFLFKSFSEVISEICRTCDGDIADMLKCKHGKWCLKENIKWQDDEDAQTKKHKILKFFNVSKKKLTLNRKSLEIQYRFIFKILMHFSSEYYDKTQKYKYNFCVLEREQNSVWLRGINFLMEAVGWAGKLKDLPDERLVWLYILDHTVHEMFKDDKSDENKNVDVVKLYAPLLQGHMSFVSKSKSNSYESFRVLTHSILRFLVSTAPYFRDGQEKPSIDAEILNSQMQTITKASDEMEGDPSAFVSFKDLIAEYNRYWGIRLFITVHNTSGYFANRITDVMQKFMKIVTVSLKKSVNIPALVEYFRPFNDFFDDFKDVDFTSCWFVKSDLYDSNVMERVDNKLSSGVNCSYRVVDIDKYIKVLGTRSVPEHYILLIMSGLLECIEQCLEQADGAEATHYIQIQRTGMLLDAIRRSLMYLKDQPDYVDFKTFFKESIDPFKRILAETAKYLTLSEFKKRIDIIKESFWYIRKMDELGIEQALQKLKSVNSCYISSELLDCYNLYLSKYNLYIANYNVLLSDGRSHWESLTAIRASIELPEAVNFTKWTKHFKTKEIPRILAGLSAIWSILVSKDLSSTGKFLKPHCIQLLCVMRLLSVDQSEGTCNHLAQVLTGQGKSVILGLLSSTLALTGHNVRVLCYSDYLSSRDQNDFEEFFKIFQIDKKIQYGTFEDMANGFLNPKCNGKKKCLRQLVQDRVHNNTEPSLGSVTTESKDTVLLIDEVDVFFTDQFYGNVYSSATITKITGLAEVQEKIWSIAKGSKYEAMEVVRLTEKFIDDEAKSGNQFYREFNAFRFSPRKSFTLLFDDPDGKLQVKEYTNRSLIEEHLLKMAESAILVGNGKKTNGFRLNEHGRISMRNSAGKYVTHSFSGYANTFNYFRLKGSNFEHMNFENYGYLLLDTGEISYARLPSQFKLILGVSGTLKDLSDHERKGIQMYDINNFSILPSFFGESNLKSNTDSDFVCLSKEEDWLKTIYDKANQIVKSFRAVLIFFDTETQLNLFSDEYRSKFDRFNDITENTKDAARDMYVNEAGLSGAVTLATRGMGRGVDYKSSLAVEKNGGIHVIQTFCSVDVKEEIQIKGRTARKDNKGSYELVLCREHLIKEKIIKEADSDSHSYSSLHRIRVELMNSKGKSHTERIEKAESNHKKTMEFYGLSQ